ncbi:MAG: hypothetical protein C0624_04810 [Desulfuromonas sp.]|nr:MAG: hypothetical protein C0624_04810 [Desulfuromonas sp.]
MNLGSLTTILLLTLFCLPPAAQGALTHDNATQLAIENQGMAWLEKTCTQEGTSITPLASDGCSGGLSAGWELLANSSSLFRQRYGERPPWEACCTAHDHIYWAGETDNGYQQRQQADQALRQCVIEQGQQQAETLSPDLEISPPEVEQLFRQAAELMYVAVRLGGGPCSGLPWRWGYGWPQCGMPSSP